MCSSYNIILLILSWVMLKGSRLFGTCPASDMNSYIALFSFKHQLGCYIPPFARLSREFWWWDQVLLRKKCLQSSCNLQQAVFSLSLHLLCGIYYSSIPLGLYNQQNMNAAVRTARKTSAEWTSISWWIICLHQDYCIHNLRQYAHGHPRSKNVCWSQMLIWSKLALCYKA